MIYETVDLYEYFSIPRGNANGGYLDLYCITDHGGLQPATRPAMLVIPGGGYSHLSEREGEPIAIAYLKNGFNSFVVKYSINTPYPAPLIEACMAVIYVRENAEKLCVDGGHIAAVGFSAGGHLAAMLANIGGESEVYSALGEKTKLARLNAAVLCYPVISLGIKTHAGSRDVITGGNKSLENRLSIEKRVTKDSAPAFIWHTFEDDCVPVENSLMLAQAYKSAGVPFELHVFEKGVHGLSLCDEVTNDPWIKESGLMRVGEWFKLSVDWLNARGFKLKR